MTFKIKLLSAAALFALPAVALSQEAQPPTGPVPSSPQPEPRAGEPGPDPTIAAPAAQQVIDEQPRQTEATPPQPAQQPPVSQNDAPPAPSATQTQPPAGAQSQAQPPAQQTPPAQSEAQPPAQANAQAQPSAQAGATRIATAADVTAGAQVRDTAGAPVGTVETVDADSAVVTTGAVRADIPIASFGHNGQGLVLAMTREQLEAAARAAQRTPTS